MQIILFVFLAYLLYRFIVGFVLPVATAASRIKKQFRNMQTNQAPNGESETAASQRSSAFSGSEKQRTTSGRKAPKEDYIDFEEVPASSNRR